jgi:hypothetical protein
MALRSLFRGNSAKGRSGSVDDVSKLVGEAASVVTVSAACAARSVCVRSRHPLGLCTQQEYTDLEIPTTEIDLDSRYAVRRIASLYAYFCASVARAPCVVAAASSTPRFACM